jgi:hypothetical protein
MNGGPLLPALPEGFGRAAEKLADTIRHVVDIAVGPDRIRAKAQAQSDAAVVFAEGRAEIQEIEARTIERLRKREMRRQHNIENITLKAVHALPPPEELSGEPVSEDWTSRFFEECEDISDEQMQVLWARILAGEVKVPGTFALRTLSAVRNLTTTDAELFTKLCQVVWYIPGAGLVPVVQDTRMKLLLEAGITFAQLLHLSSIGLIEFSHMTAFGLHGRLTEVSVFYCGREHKLKSDGGAERTFEFGHVLFTAVGRELVQIAEAPGIEDFRTEVLRKWAESGWKEMEVETTAK